MQLIDMRPAFPPENYGDRVRPPRLFILHHTETASAAATRATLLQRGLSTHAEVTRWGEVLLYLDPATAVAYHAGHGENSDTIGIDFTHLQGQDFTPEQLAAGRWLLAEWGREYAIPLVAAPDRCAIDSAPGCLDLTTAPTLIAAGDGVARHRNVGTTICPDNLPIAELVAPAPALAGAGDIVGVLAALGLGIVIARAIRSRAR